MYKLSVVINGISYHGSEIVQVFVDSNQFLAGEILPKTA